MKESVKESHKLIKDSKQTEHSKAIKNSSRDINKNILNDRNDRSRTSLNSAVWYETKKPFRWRPLAWRRKQWLLLLSLAIFVFLVNATLNHLDNGDPDNGSDLDRAGDEKNFRLQHLHSHVPGMKGKRAYIGCKINVMRRAMFLFFFFFYHFYLFYVVFTKHIKMFYLQLFFLVCPLTEWYIKLLILFVMQK